MHHLDWRGRLLASKAKRVVVVIGSDIALRACPHVEASTNIWRFDNDHILSVTCVVSLAFDGR